MKEAEARAALEASDAGGGTEPWIAERPWKTEAGGWSVPGELQGWRFRLEVVPGGVRVASTPGGSAPAVWFVPGPVRLGPALFVA